MSVEIEVALIHTEMAVVAEDTTKGEVSTNRSVTHTFSCDQNKRNLICIDSIGLAGWVYRSAYSTNLE